MKICPFCKKRILENFDTCPHCQRVLFERIGNPSSYKSSATKLKTKSQLIKKIEKSFRSFLFRIKYLKFNNFKKYVLVFALFLFAVFSSLLRGEDNTFSITNKTPVSVIPNNGSGVPKLVDVATITSKDPKTFRSLPGGTILFKNPRYLNGLGELKIDNGTNLDAIAKLVNISINKSVLTVYIKANSAHTINKVLDGNYKLFFNLGNDWDDEIKAFSVNSAYSVFEEVFDFTTTEYNEGDYVHTQYSAFRVTLNPVVGGQAKTDEIPDVEFGSY